MQEYATCNAAVTERTARLQSLRLAKEADAGSCRIAASPFKGRPHGRTNIMTTFTNSADRAAVRLYDQSRGNGSYHELALRIATAAWRKSYPEATADEAEHAVKRAVWGARITPKPTADRSERY